jgi:preprotein translocase subunit YajC
VDLFPIVLLVVFAVVLFVLPARQRKRMQAQAQALQESLNIGTPVTTTSGLHGTVAGLAERTVDLEIAPGVVVTFARPAIMEVRSPAVAPEGGTPGIDGTTGIDGTGFDGPANGTTGGRPADGPL